MPEFAEVFSPSTAISVGGIVAGAAYLSKKPKEQLHTFFTEFVGSLALYHLFFVGCTYIINNESIPQGVDWIYHALCVLGLDFGTSGASLNPAISAGAWIYGLIDFWTLVVHLTAQIYASNFGFYSLKTMNGVLGDDLAAAIRGPSFDHLSDVMKIPHFGIEVGGENNVLHALIVEGVTTFILALAIFLVEKRVKNGLAKISIIAATIRFCLYFGEDITGANMNPMIAYSWLFYFSRGNTSLLGAYYQKEYIVVYCVAPMIAAGFAALLVSALPENVDVATPAMNETPKPKGEARAAKAPTSKGRTSSRGRGRKVQEEEPEEKGTEGDDDDEENKEESEVEPVVVKKSAPKARGRTASRGQKAVASPKPSPSPVRRRSGRRKK
jgi:glycerol uptake facilitator-like aquaporin